jgi:hypothetical protein
MKTSDVQKDAAVQRVEVQLHAFLTSALDVSRHHFATALVSEKETSMPTG